LLSLLVRKFPDAAFISASEDVNIGTLITKVENLVLGNSLLKLKLPYDKSALASKLHDIAIVLSETYGEDGIHLEVQISRDDRYLVEPYIE